MFKRLASVTITLVTLVMFVPAASLAASSGGGGTTGCSGFEGPILGTEDGCPVGRAATPDIQAGLCVGASLNLSTASQLNCKRQVQAARDNPAPARPPNIQAGLCVGANLNLNTATQLSCQRQVAQGQASQQNNPPAQSHGQANGGQTNGGNPPPSHSHSNRPPTASRGNYAALGDSVAAGIGLNAPVDNQWVCGRNAGAYPYLVARDSGMDVTNLACEGAKMGDLFTEQGIAGPNLPPQLDGAFSNGTPRLMTITAGANDVHWVFFLRKCFSGDCGSAADTRYADSLNSALAAKVQFALQDIERRSGGSPPRVVLTGYYHPLSDSCSMTDPHLSSAEITWMNAEIDSLNQTIQNAASHTNFAKFAPVDFSGHDICSSESWVQGPDDSAPFHPTAEGQQQIAHAVEAKAF